MSQLTFGESFGDKKDLNKKEERKDSWYKGRVLSHSSISTYQQCPQKWKFRYVEKIPEKPKSYFSFGKSVHSGLEFLFSNIEGPLPDLEKVLEHYKQTWISEGYESSNQEKWFFNEGDRIIRGFYAKHKNDDRKVLKVEFRFSFDIAGVPMVGFVDRIDQTKSGRLAIVDYKTGKAFDKSRVRKDPQLTLYQIACRDLLGKEVESVTLYHLNTLTPLTVPSHSSHLEKELTTSIVESAKGINQEKFDPKPEPRGYCRWCDYIQVCPAFSGKKKYSGKKEMDRFLVEDVDRYGKLDEKIQDLKDEKNALGQKLMPHVQKSENKQVQGEHFVLKMNDSSVNGDDQIISEPIKGSGENEITH